MACFSKQDIGACGCSCSLQVQVKGCGSTPLAVGSGLTVDLKVSGSTIYTGTTNSSGIAAITGAAGTYDVVVTDGRTPSRWTTQTFTGQTLSCGGTTNVTLSTPKAGYQCTDLCGDPLAETLYATDPNGTWTMTYASGQWTSECASHTSMASVVTALTAGICTATVGTGTVPYVITLTTGGTLSDFWGIYPVPGQIRTSATPTCSGGVLDLDGGVPVSCTGVIESASAGLTPSAVCPPSLSLTATMTSPGATTNPGAGAITVTE